MDCGRSTASRTTVAPGDQYIDLEREALAMLKRARSVAGAAAISDASLDWVYIDADHTYEGVMNDLRAYAPKVRPGGLVCGDDYGVAGWCENGVQRAVDAFVRDSSWQFKELRGTQFVFHRA